MGSGSSSKTQFRELEKLFLENPGPAGQAESLAVAGGVHEGETDVTPHHTRLSFSSSSLWLVWDENPPLDP